MPPRSRILAGGGAALGAVLLGSAVYTVPHVHNDLTQEALRHIAVELGAAPTYEGQPHDKQAVLATLAPYGISNLTMSGHRATITGSPRTDAEIDALEAVAVRWGVADVRYEVDPNAVATAGGGARVSLADGVVTLRGAVASEAQRRTLVTAAQQVYGAGSVIDRLTVVAPSPGSGSSGAGASGATLRDAQVEALAAMITAAGKASALEGSVSPSAVRFRATVATATEKAAVDARATAAAAGAGVAVDSQVTASSAGPTSTAIPTTSAAPTTSGAAPTTSAASPTTSAPVAPTTTNSPVAPTTTLASGGTPEQQVTSLQRELDALAAVQQQTVFFASGSAQLTPEAMATLGKVADAMARYPSPSVDVGGHTDSDGDDEVNRQLSEARAGAVRDALIGLGVAPARLSAIGYGETAPRADNATPEGRAQNRRVEFVVKKGS